MEVRREERVPEQPEVLLPAGGEGWTGLDGARTRRRIPDCAVSWTCCQWSCWGKGGLVVVRAAEFWTSWSLLRGFWGRLKEERCCNLKGRRGSMGGGAEGGTETEDVTQADAMLLISVKPSVHMEELSTFFGWGGVGGDIEATRR